MIVCIKRRNEEKIVEKAGQILKMEENLLTNENGFITQTIRGNLTMGNDNGQELFSVRLKALERRLKEIDEIGRKKRI